MLQMRGIRQGLLLAGGIVFINIVPASAQSAPIVSPRTTTITDNQEFFPPKPQPAAPQMPNFQTSPNTTITSEQDFYGPLTPAPQPHQTVLCRSERIAYDGVSNIEVPASCANTEGACNCKVAENENFFEMRVPILQSNLQEAIRERILNVLTRNTAAGFAVCEELFC